MKRKLKNFYRKTSQGQAFAELAIMMTVLIVLVFGTVEFGKMISMSSRMAMVARETGRTINAQEYDPDQMVDVFGIVTNMVYPANLQTEGRVIVSFLQRVAGSRTDIFITPPADTNRDYLIITDRFFYPYQSGDPRLAATNTAVTSWTTHLPTTFDNGTTDPDTRRYIAFSNNVGPIPLDMLLPSGRTAVVEVFYTNKLSAPITNFGINVSPYMYDVAAF